MHPDPYEMLALALDRLPNGFPSTPERIELRILKKLFSPEEAAIACRLTGTFESLEAISQRTGLPAADLRKPLHAMVKRGLLWFDKSDRQLCYRLVPFIVGFYEEQRENLDLELAQLVEDYFHAGAAVALMTPQPAFHRVLPTQGTVKSEWILPYEDVRGIILKAKTYRSGDCICRKQQDLLGHRCDFPLDNCLSFSPVAREPQPGDLTQAEALAILDKTEQMGLVHTVSNSVEGVFYVCNCCGCCCGILRGITEYGINESVAHANYYAVIDTEMCSNCGTCIQRCQVGAITEGDGHSVVDVARCIGCGLCVTGCPNEVAHLERKPESEQIHPPVNFSAWEHERLHNRGMGE